MKSTTTTSAEEINRTKPEEFDLVILGGGTGSTIAAWTFAEALELDKTPGHLLVLGSRIRRCAIRS